MAESKADLFDEARKRWKYATSVGSAQNKREQEDLQFQVAELQWDEQARRERGEQKVGDYTIPARPMISVSKIDQPMSIVFNGIRQADLGINVLPLSPGADEVAAETIQGLYRQIERDSRASIAREWAVDRAIKCGRGVYRINTRYADEAGGSPFDQVITIDRVLYQESVVFDPAATEPDFSDAAYAFVGSWIPYKEFRALYPRDDTAPGPTSNFTNEVWEDPEWVTGEGEQAAVRVAEYFRRTWKTEELYLLASPIGDQGAVVKDGETFTDLNGNPLSEMPEFAVGPNGQPITRKRRTPMIEWAKVSAAGTVEGPFPWNGRYIPLVMVLGEELQPFDEERRWQGMIRPARDPQRTFNYGISTLVEKAAQEPRSPWVGTAKQFENYESLWQQANRRNYPFLLYNAVQGPGGQLVPPPQRTPTDVSALGPSLTLMEQATSALQSTMATYDPSLGQISGQERSGRAILALQEQSDVSNSDYGQQLAEISMRYEARVILDLIPRIYGERPGRVVRILDDQEDTSTVMLGVPYIRDPHTGMPIPAAGPDGQVIQPPPGPDGKPVKVHDAIDLQAGVYSVTVSVGKAYQTRLQEGSLEMGRILERLPDLVKLIGPEYFRFRTFPGAEKIAEILLKVRDMEYPFLMESDEDMTPEQAKAQVVALRAQLEQMQGALSQAQQEGQKDAMKVSADLQRAQMDNATRLQVAQINQQTAVLEQLLENKFKMIQESVARQIDEKWKTIELLQGGRAD